VAYAGAPMTPALAAQLTGTLAPEVFVNHFGSTEIYTFTIGPARKPGCAGRAGVFSRVRLVDPVSCAGAPATATSCPPSPRSPAPTPTASPPP
jgi:acyl-coenzyme A synthetase/AMP-(fatty) acid ligase